MDTPPGGVVYGKREEPRPSLGPFLRRRVTHVAAALRRVVHVEEQPELGRVPRCGHQVGEEARRRHVHQRRAGRFDVDAPLEQAREEVVGDAPVEVRVVGLVDQLGVWAVYPLRRAPGRESAQLECVAHLDGMLRKVFPVKDPMGPVERQEAPVRPVRYEPALFGVHGVGQLKGVGVALAEEGQVLLRAWRLGQSPLACGSSCGHRPSTCPSLGHGQRTA